MSIEIEYGTSDFGVDYSKLSGTPKMKSRTPKTPKGDRFIPNRSAMDLEMSHFNLLSKENVPNMPNCDAAEYKERLAETLFQEKQAKVLAFKSKAPTPKENSENAHKVLYSCNKTSAAKPKTTRHISQNAERVLDAPGFLNDYYLNLVDWSKQNIVAVALSGSVFLWNAGSGEIHELMKTQNESDCITSVQWTKEGQHLSVGMSNGVVELWDAQAGRALRNLGGHAARVGALSWNNFILSSGSKDTTIHHHDVRIQNHLTASLENHTQEVCGLKWSEDGTQLASGGNDNIVNIWDINETKPKFTFSEHTAAVKALAWCPWQKDLLATGGGSADRTLRFYNTTSGSCLNSIDTGSQVSSIVWAKNCKELVTSHGYAQNQLCVWKYPSLVKTAELTGHSDRILSLVLGPDNKSVMSASADETLRFWNIFDVEVKSQAKKQETRASSLSRPMSLIR